MNRLAVFLLGLVAANVAVAEPKGALVETGSLSSDDATQAACADEKFVYAVSNTRVVKYDRTTGKQVAVSEGEAYHLNHALKKGDKIYLAHSYYPKKPNECDIRVLDPETMKLTVHHAFKDPPGSLTWMIPLLNKPGWLCCFAHYGDNNGKTVLVAFDGNWNEFRRWTFPEKLVADWGKNSLSSAVGPSFFGVFIATGHDKKVVYLLRAPSDGGEVIWYDTVPAPFPGQGIAVDVQTGGLVGIDRNKKKVIFAKYEE